MRTLMHVHIDPQPGRDAIQNGSLPKTIQTLVSHLEPEAYYFFTDHGRRSALFVFDMADTAQIPAIAEPLFAAFHAEVSFTPVMNLNDLQKGLTRMAEAR